MFRIRINSIEVTFIIFNYSGYIFFDTLPYRSTIKGNRCNVVNTKCVYRLLYSIFINKVIRLFALFIQILLRFFSLKIRFFKTLN